MAFLTINGWEIDVLDGSASVSDVDVGVRGGGYSGASRDARRAIGSQLKASTVLMPRPIASRTLFSVLTFSSARRMDSSSACRGMIRTPSISPKTMSPGLTRTPCTSTGTRQSTTLPRAPWSWA